MKYLTIQFKAFILFSFIITSQSIDGQVYLDSTVNSSTKRVQFANANQFSLGSYGEAHFNQKYVPGVYKNGTADIHRIILFTGYKFNKNLQFFSEIEFEHVKEVYVEQAFLNYGFNSGINFKAGMILIPMGYVNEFHEPTLFNGVERPHIDKYIIPTTWRELGFGFHGILKNVNLKYQLYMVNGFNGFDGDANISGKSGLRSARQKGAEVVVTSPALTGKVTFYGLNGLRFGLSGYHGASETNLYDGLDQSDVQLISSADSSRVGISMLACNVNYSKGNFNFRGEANLTNLSNTQQYNAFAETDAGSSIMGYYGEVAYRINLNKSFDYPALNPFVRYENYDTHFKTEGDLVKNEAYHRKEYTFGVGLQITPGAVFKADYQLISNKTNTSSYNQLNIGFGYWF